MQIWYKPSLTFYVASVPALLSKGVTLALLVFVPDSVGTFSQPCFNPESVTLVSYPGMANHRSLLNVRLIRPC